MDVKRIGASLWLGDEYIWQNDVIIIAGILPLPERLSCSRGP